MNINSTSTVLVVDDVDMNLQLAQKLLEGWGLNVLLATNGSEALSIFSRNKVDLILMDIQMPEMDGLQATSRIREFSDLPVIAVTANTSTEETNRYKLAGMNDFLSKPIDEGKLFDLLSRYIQLEGKNITQANKPEEVKLYDFKLIEEISGGDQEFVKKMMGMFIDTIPEMINDLQYNVDYANWEKVSMIAHRMKSTIDSMNIKTIKTEIRQLEANGKQLLHLEQMPGLCQKVSSVLKECIESVSKDLES